MFDYTEIVEMSGKDCFSVAAILTLQMKFLHYVVYKR